jgi:tetratricopeptide (TPR) repeat protein
MGTMQNEEYLELGLLYAREGNLAAALKSLNTALLKYAGLENPQAQVSPRVLDEVPLELLSYYGMCIALVQNRVDEGIRLCRRSLAKDTLRPEFYLNLGKVYVKANQKAKALKVFQRGLEVSERNRELVNEIRKMGIRRKRPLSFLPRNHVLNRYSGLLLHKLGIEGKPEIPYFGRGGVQ